MKISPRKLDEIYNVCCVDILRLLKANNHHFSIWCDMRKVRFNPPLSQEIMVKFEDFGLFVLAGYTFESLEISNSKVFFEAGFGTDNEGSLVEVSINGIYQIISKDIHNSDIPLFTRIDSALIFDISAFNQEINLNKEEQTSIDVILSNANNLKALHYLKSLPRNNIE